MNRMIIMTLMIFSLNSFAIEVDSEKETITIQKSDIIENGINMYSIGINPENRDLSINNLSHKTAETVTTPMHYALGFNVIDDDGEESLYYLSCAVFDEDTLGPCVKAKEGASAALESGKKLKLQFEYGNVVDIVPVGWSWETFINLITFK